MNTESELTRKGIPRIFWPPTDKSGNTLIRWKPRGQKRADAQRGMWGR